MKIITISSMEDLIYRLLNFPNNYVFRGHSVAEWKLIPSLERIISTEKWDAGYVTKLEDYSLSQFKSRFHLYDRENKSPVSKLEWLSIMQHYGTPTRLLDFSTSPFMALYFAIENNALAYPSDCAIYAIDFSAVMKKSVSIINEICPELGLDFMVVSQEQNIYYDEIIDNSHFDVIWITEPQQLNARLDRQGGSFILSGNKGVRLEELLFSEPYSDCDIQKIIVQKKFFPNVYALLNKINISSRTVYGDLQGFAKSLGMEMTYYAG